MHVSRKVSPPASLAKAPSSRTVKGANSLGLTMTELPAARAGASFLTAMNKAKSGNRERNKSRSVRISRQRLLLVPEYSKIYTHDDSKE